MAKTNFTFCELGAPMRIESLLSGKDMPGYEALARYVFYTATGQSLDKVPAVMTSGFIGESELFRVYLIYKPDKAWLRSNEAALNMEQMKIIEKENNGGKRAVVFAVAKFMSQKELTKRRIAAQFSQSLFQGADRRRQNSAGRRGSGAHPDRLL